MGGARRLRQLLLHGLAASVLASPAFADPAIWKVSDGDSSIHLFGSVHVFTREIDWRTPQFDALLTAADQVVFEVIMDVDAYAEVTQLGLTKGVLSDGKTLVDVMESGDYARLLDLAAAGEMDVELLTRMQPWLAAMTLMAPATGDMLGGVELTIDPEIAPERKRELESAGEQMSILADAPLDEQLVSLRAVLDALESGVDPSFDPVIDAWLRGDEPGILAFIDEQMMPGVDPAYDRIITRRNENWIGPLEQLLADNDGALVVVGVGHLVGAGGVPTLLAGKGYDVERIDAPAIAARSHVLPGALGRAATRR